MNKMNKKYRVTINAGYRKTVFEFEDFAVMTGFVNSLLKYRVKSDRDDEDEDLNAVQIELIKLSEPQEEKDNDVSEV